MKKLFLAFIGLSISVMVMSQSVIVLNSLEMLPNSNALMDYNNEFGMFENKVLDDPFPYVVIRIELQGDVREAKMRLNLDLGPFYKVEASNKNRDNIILFLIPKSARSIYLLCGDGCEKQQLHLDTLQMNKVYTCKVEYKAREKQIDASKNVIDEMKKQIEQMQKLIQQLNDNQQQASANMDGNTEQKSYPATIEQGVLKKVSVDFNGEFVISDNVTSIGDSAFYNCTNLTGMTIPNSVTSIGDEAFEGCELLSTIYVFKDSEKRIKKLLPKELRSLVKVKE